MSEDVVRWLVLRLSAPMLSFGAVAIDHVGPTARWPGASMLTGLMGNALGWEWDDHAAHQALQDRLRFGAVILREGDVLTDSQNASLGKADRGWTTRGAPEGRTGASYDDPHRRRRDYLQDADYRVVLTLAPVDVLPTLDVIAEALDRPARPLFLGRKPCIPTHPLNGGFVEAPTV
jgi:CRISPR system Cascade subunit CasD